MIAPLRQTEERPRPRGLRRAHRLVASTLLKNRRPASDNARPVSAWQAWLFTLWVVTVTVVYLAYMAGLL